LLWFAINGKPMSYASMGDLIIETTRMTIGIAVSPHLFRTAGVTTLATHAGNKSNLTPVAPFCITDRTVLRKTTIGRRA
jgi:hypothetical protein